ncbi:MAG: caspase family protein [Gammaproteobacteria bacterium SHHR-1]
MVTCHRNSVDARFELQRQVIPGEGDQPDCGLYRVRNPELAAAKVISLDKLLLSKLLSGGNRKGANLLILDACRDNPLGKGWAEPGQGANATGLFWALGTGYGDTASDQSRNGRNGVFTQHILRHIGTKGLTLDQIMKQVTEDVSAETQGKQVPKINSSLVRDVIIAPRCAFRRT